MDSKTEQDEAVQPFIPTSPPRDDEFDADAKEDFPPQVQRRRRTTLALFCSGAALASLLWAAGWAVYSKLNADPVSAPPMMTTTTTTTTSCGSNHSAALANDCVFQLWSYSWVPKECFDKELHDEFLELRDKEDWHYYSSLDPLVQVPLDSVLTGTRNDLRSTWGQHFWHCAFYQRKFFRVVEEHDGASTPALKMTNRDLSPEHGLHCQEWLTKPQFYPWDEVRINLTVGYNSCS